MPFVTLVAYAALFVTLSGTFRRPQLRHVREGTRWNRRGILAWLCAFASLTAVPWSGAPVSVYFGMGSWLWFPSAAASLFLLPPDECGNFRERRLFAALNTAAAVGSVYVFMLFAGAPGDIPGIEGLAAVCAIEGLVSKCMAAARILFFVSCVISFASVYYNLPESAPALLSFSYSAFVSIAFLPPIRVFLAPANPGRAIMADTAAYMAFAFVIHHFIMKPFSEYLAPRWKRRAAAINAAVTLLGTIFLFLSLF